MLLLLVPSLKDIVLVPVPSSIAAPSKYKTPSSEFIKSVDPAPVIESANLVAIVPLVGM